MSGSGSTQNQCAYAVGSSGIRAGVACLRFDRDGWLGTAFSLSRLGKLWGTFCTDTHVGSTKSLLT